MTKDMREKEPSLGTRFSALIQPEGQMEERKVEIVRSQYQPTKAEKKEDIDVAHLEGMTREKWRIP